MPRKDTRFILRQLDFIKTFVNRQSKYLDLFLINKKIKETILKLFNLLLYSYFTFFFKFD